VQGVEGDPPEQEVDVRAQANERVGPEDQVLGRLPRSDELDEAGRGVPLLAGRKPPERRIEAIERIVEELPPLPIGRLSGVNPGRIEIDGGAAARRHTGALGRGLRAHIAMAASG
jgi:hypothetical protein